MARKAFWQDTIIDEATPSTAQDITSLMGPMTQQDRRDITLVRTIISLDLVPPTAVSDGFMIHAMGIGVVSQEAFAATVVPDPNVQEDRPARGWVWRDQRTVVGAASMASYSPTHVMADIRGSRKLDDGELVLIMNANTIDGTAFIVKTSGLIRVVFLHA